MPPKLKAKYEKEDDIPEEYRELYSDREGIWYIADIEGMSTEGNVGRLEVALKKSREANAVMKQKLDKIGKDPEEILTMSDRIIELEALVEAGGKPDPEKMESLVQAKLKTLMGPVTRELETLKKTNEELLQGNEKLTKTISTGKMNALIQAAGTKGGMNKFGITDYQLLGKDIFEFVEIEGVEKAVTKEGCGFTPGLDPLQLIPELHEPKPHWFLETVGAGASGGNRQPGGGGPNPWSAENWSLDEQAKLMRTLPAEKYEKMAKQAGSFVGAATPPTKKS